MVLVEVNALIILAAATTYAVLGGADFGGGVWDLLARGPRKQAQRDAISHAMGPVWEANHVWLIFAITVLFTAFPRAFATLSLAFFALWHLVLLGIILRGAAFVFRAYGPRAGAFALPWGFLFGAASLLTPLLLGMTVGTIASGDLRLGEAGVELRRGAPWLAPEAWSVGLLTVAVAAYLAAMFLVLETDGELREDFRRRAIAAWAAVAGLALLTMGVLEAAAPELLARFRGPPAWLVGGAAVAAAGAALGGLALGRFALARAAAVAQVVLLIVGWAVVMQYPYLLFPDLTLHDAAAPADTLRFVAAAVPVGAVVLVPSLVFLFRVFKGRALGMAP